MKNIALTLALALIAGVTNAEVMVMQEGSPTVNVDGGTTWKLTLVSDNPEEIIFGVNASIDATAGQLGNVRGGPITTTPFQDSNGFFDFVGADASQDTQFLFMSTNLSPPALSVVDTPERLAGAITNLPGATNGDGLSVMLLQVALGPSAGADYRFALDLRNSAGQNVGAPVLEGRVGIPEPATFGLGGLALAALGYRRRR